MRAVSMWSRSPGCCVFSGVFWVGRCFPCCSGNHFFFSNSCTSTRPLASRDPDSSQRRLREGAPTVSQSAHRELAPTDPHQVYCLVCSHLRNMASSDDQYSRSHSPTSQCDPRPHECNLNNFSSFDSASRQCSRDRTYRQTYARGTSRHVF